MAADCTPPSLTHQNYQIQIHQLYSFTKKVFPLAFDGKLVVQTEYYNLIGQGLYTPLHLEL